ncbi:MAG: glycoside hydrolase family 5 protein [Proteobacteria bacterium]|nr:glycoside hydrolase family 5 protein [Pseudomonadota bacterium]MBU1716052.1 glycoside hydrolase family 5 protein [Pseudomonadota bacterium]
MDLNQICFGQKKKKLTDVSALSGPGKRHSSRRRENRFLWVVLIFSLLLLVAVGCGGGGSSSSQIDDEAGLPNIDGEEVPPSPDDEAIPSDPEVAADSPFGVAEHFNTLATVATQADELGFRAIRLAGPQAIAWDRVQQDGWTNDALYAELTAAGYELSVVVLGGNPAATGTLTEYAEFITELVERYDGDGTDDAPGSPRIAIIEIDNEPDLYEGPQEQTPWHGELSETSDYAAVLQTAYAAAKVASPDMQVAIAGMGFDVDYYGAILAALAGETAFDLFNFHYYSPEDKYFQLGVPMINGIDTSPSLAEVQAMLAAVGYADFPIIITETATYSGTSFFGTGGGDLPVQTEREQAISLVRRYLYAATRGVSRIFWFQPLGEAGNALVNGAQRKLAYYTYMRMVDELDGVDFAGAQIVCDGDDGIYIHKLIRDGDPVWVLWRDGDESLGTMNVPVAVGDIGPLRAITSVPSGTVGGDLDFGSYADLFVELEVTPVAGEVTLAVGAVPIYLRP